MDYKYDWCGNYVTARTALGWSDEDFWKATPRKFYAFLFTYAKLRENAMTDNQEVLVGESAFKALSQMVSQCNR